MLRRMEMKTEVRGPSLVPLFKKRLSLQFHVVHSSSGASEVVSSSAYYWGVSLYTLQRNHAP